MFELTFEPITSRFSIKPKSMRLLIFIYFTLIFWVSMFGFYFLRYCFCRFCRFLLFLNIFEQCTVWINININVTTTPFIKPSHISAYHRLQKALNRVHDIFMFRYILLFRLDVLFHYRICDLFIRLKLQCRKCNSLFA